MTAKETALKEVTKRIVTKDQAKSDFIKWIDETVKINHYVGQDIVDWWKEVKQEAEKL